MFKRLNICIYGLHVCIFSDLYPCTPTELHIHIYSVRPQITTHKPLALQEAAVSMIKQHNKVLQKPLKTSIKKYLDSTTNYNYLVQPNGIT